MRGHELGMIKFLFDGAWRSDGRKVLKFHLGRTDAECVYDHLVNILL